MRPSHRPSSVSTANTSTRCRPTSSTSTAPDRDLHHPHNSVLLRSDIDSQRTKWGPASTNRCVRPGNRSKSIACPPASDTERQAQEEMKACIAVHALRHVESHPQRGDSCCCRSLHFSCPTEVARPSAPFRYHPDRLPSRPTRASALIAAFGMIISSH